MKKVLKFSAVFAALITTASYAIAQTAPAAAAVADEVPMHQQLKIMFIDGGPAFMTPIVLVFILGIAFCIERIIYLSLASTNTKKLLTNIESALAKGGINAAKEVCRNERGPVASIFYQGLDRYDEGLDMVEKSVVAYGSVQMGQLETNLPWIGLFISLAPMLGFFGTVIGMVQAFDDIQNAGDMSPSIVAGGMKVALITTVAGLVAAMILQVFYNYIMTKVDALVNNMEDASISLVDILVKYNIKK